MNVLWNSQENVLEQDYAFEALKDLLLADFRTNIVEQQARLNETIATVEQIENQMGDHHGLIEIINPVIAGSIKTKIRDDRDEMIDVLYPIIGSLIQRAVSEAIIDLKRQIDSQMNKAFDLEQIKRRLRGLFGVVPLADSAIIYSLPFEVGSIFLIHRETGILISYLSSNDTDTISDSDIISGMLTAIRDFMSDVFSGGEGGNEAQLDEIQYGENRILIEPANHVYVAVVTSGYVPHGFRSVIRQILFDIQAEYSDLLRNYDGNAVPFEPVRERLYNFMLEQNQRYSVSVLTDPIPTDAQSEFLSGFSDRSERWLLENFHIIIPVMMLILTLLLVALV